MNNGFVLLRILHRNISDSYGFAAHKKNNYSFQHSLLARFFFFICKRNALEHSKRLYSLQLVNFAINLKIKHINQIFDNTRYDMIRGYFKENGKRNYDLMFLTLIAVINDLKMVLVRIYFRRPIGQHYYYYVIQIINFMHI